MEQRERFIADHRRALSMSELCGRYGISRKTGYKWLETFNDEGRAGLQDRSHAAHHCPHKIEPKIAAPLCAARRAHPSWGPIMLLDWLRPLQPKIREWPAPSTVGDLLAREGLVRKRRRRRLVKPPGVLPIRTNAPNDLWTADFKGALPHPRRDLLLPADDRRPAHPLSDRVSRTALHQGRRGPPRFRASIPQVRVTRRGPNRQWRALRNNGHPRPLQAQRLVDATGHSAPTDPASLTPAERRP